MKKLILVCLCLFSTCQYNATVAGTKPYKRFIHYVAEGIYIWEDRDLGVVCYNFGNGNYSCIQNRYI
jgi:hypothetical protein